MARKFSLFTASMLPLFFCSNLVLAIDIDPTSPDSISQAATSIAAGLFDAYYDANATTGDFKQPKPWFWWLSGSGWTAVMDHIVYTNDTTHKAALLSALSDNVGENYDFKPAAQQSWEANDDQMYWLYSALTALEYNFEALPCEGKGSGVNGSCANSWLNLATNAFNGFVIRWNADVGTCSGGMKWQYTASSNGYYYKNSVTNGGFFQTAARLARYTGNSTYADWAVRVWNWSVAVGLVGNEFNVFDGTSDEGTNNCTAVNDVQWSYNVATYLHGAANMYVYEGNRGNSVRQVQWGGRIGGFLNAANITFFSPPSGNASGVMYEQNCETDSTCTIDQTSFKSSLARWLGKTAALVPSARNEILSLMATTATSAAGSCTETSGVMACGMKWWVGGFDGVTDFGSQLSALEAVQSLLVTNAPGLISSTA